MGAQVLDQRGDVVERRDGAEDVGVGPHEHGVGVVLVEPGGQPAVEVLEPVEGDGARADPLEERHVVVGQVDRPPGEQDELRADDVVEAAFAAVHTDHALHGAMAGQGPSRGQRARLRWRQRERRRRVRRPQRGVALGGGLRVERARHARHLDREVHDPLVVRRALGRVAVEQVVVGRPAAE